MQSFFPVEVSENPCRGKSVLEADTKKRRTRCIPHGRIHTFMSLLQRPGSVTCDVGATINFLCVAGRGPSSSRHAHRTDANKNLSLRFMSSQILFFFSTICDHLVSPYDHYISYSYYYW
jgi:hypothetical protein